MDKGGRCLSLEALSRPSSAQPPACQRPAQSRPKRALGEAREDACGAELAAGDEV